MSNKLLTLILLLLSATVLHAQSYEIRAVNKGAGVVGVEMRIVAGTPPTTADFITDLVFGLKWLASYNVDLENNITTNYGIVKSAGRQTKGTYHFQAFSAANTPFSFPANWTLNSWVEILSVRNTLTGIGTGTFEVTELGFDGTTEPNFGVSLTDLTPVVTASATLVPLPVNIIRFDVAARQNTILVQWVTDFEENVKGFEVERAEQQDPNQFKRIATLPGKGSAGGKYEITDRTVTGGIRYYYRLKQIDLDERFRYSDTRTAILDDVGNTSIMLLPNPVDKELRLQFDGTIQADQLLIRITDARGRVVQARDYRLSTGRTLLMNVVPLMQGQYFLTVESNKSVLAVKPFFKR